jgi:hypothetical protein
MLEGLMDDDRHDFLLGDTAEHALVREIVSVPRMDTVVNFAADCHVGRSIDGPIDHYDQRDVHDQLVAVRTVDLERARCRRKACLPLLAWIDTGTHDLLMKANTFIQMIEESQWRKIACHEEIVLSQEWMTAEQLQEQSELLSKNGYGQYLLSILQHGPVFLRSSARYEIKIVH